MMRRFLSFWRNLLRRDRVERDLDDEMRATLAALIEEKCAAGASREVATRAALIELGGVESVKVQVRDVRAGAGLETLLQDLRYAARLLRRNPLFTLTAALSLAVGIGATTAVFTIGNGLLLRATAGVPEPERLVDLVRRPPGANPGVELLSYPDLVDVRARATLFEEVFGYQFILDASSLRIGDTTTAVYPTLVTTNYFRALGVHPAVGRLFDRGDSEQAGAAPVMVLSHRFWTRLFDGDPAVVGQTVRFNNVPMTVVGVAPEGFTGLSVTAPDAWLPVGMITARSPEGKGIEMVKRIPWLAGGARLKPGVTRAQASAQIRAVGAGIQSTGKGNPWVPPDDAHEADPKSLVWSAEAASPIPYGMRIVVAGFVGLLMAVVSIVLVIACANLTGVLLARATNRRREIAVRTAIGAARPRLVRQMLTETVLLFALGGVAGLWLARMLVSLLMGLLPAFPVPVSLSVPLDARVVFFALGLSFVAAVLAGLAPALHASRSDVVAALKDDTQGPVDRHRLRNAFVVAQIAFSILLVVVASLLVRGFDDSLSRAQQLDVRGVDAVSVDLSMGGYTQATGPEAMGRLLNQVRQIQGVTAAAIADRSPQDGGSRVMGSVSRGNGAAADGRTAFQFNWHLTSPGYFQTLGMTLVSGRDFAASDTTTGEPVAIVGERTARELWPGREAIGQYLEISPALFDPSKPRNAMALRVVGVVDDQTTEGSLPLYVPIAQRYLPTITIMTKVAPDQPSIAAVVAAVVDDSGLPALTSGPLERTGDGPPQTLLRIASTVAGTAGIIGLLLAAVGIYGVTAYAVTQRTREIGIRLSLGASAREVVLLVLRQGMTLVAIGSAIGVALAAAAAQLMSGRQFGLRNDPLALAAAAALFMGVGLVACYIPVRRAARIKASEALRYE
jgi:predicted permease